MILLRFFLKVKFKKSVFVHRTGYFADQLSVAQEIRGNLTIRVKNESRGFHLNNLSYAGPIVMGVGGNDNILQKLLNDIIPCLNSIHQKLRPCFKTTISNSFIIHNLRI